MDEDYLNYVYRRLRLLSFKQFSCLLHRIADACRVFGLIYKVDDLKDVALMLNEIKRINSREAALIWESLYGGYRSVIEWDGKRYGLYTDLPLSLHLPIALLDENGELVTHVVVTRWDSLYFRPETVQEYSGKLKESWFVQAHSVPVDHVHDWLQSYTIYRLIKFEWGGQSYFILNPESDRQAILPICLPGTPTTFLKASSLNHTHPRQLNDLHPVEWKGGTCNFAVYNREVRM